jgi:hypothetical protein
MEQIENYSVMKTSALRSQAASESAGKAWHRRGSDDRLLRSRVLQLRADACSPRWFRREHGKRHDGPRNRERAHAGASRSFGETLRRLL